MAEETKTAHTPGPWKVVGAGIEACMVSETNSVGRRVPRRIAVVKAPTIAQIQADARLIAAAPDLLAALVALINEGQKSLDIHGIDSGVEQSTVAAARAAIAKARPTPAQE